MRRGWRPRGGSGRQSPGDREGLHERFHATRAWSGHQAGASSGITSLRGATDMRRTSWVVGILLLCAPVPVLAQDSRGTISGTVRDAQGVIPGASVKITNVETNVSQEVVTNATGYFE